MRRRRRYASVETGFEPYTLRPDGAGDFTQLTPSAGSNYDCVNEIITNNADYVYQTVQAVPKYEYDLYSIPITAIPHGNIAFVRVYTVMKHGSGATGVGKATLKTHSTNYYGSEETLTTSYCSYYKTWINNPTTGLAWTRSEILALQIGVSLKAGSAANTEAYCSQVYVVIGQGDETLIYNWTFNEADTSGTTINDVYGNYGTHYDNATPSIPDFTTDQNGVANKAIDFEVASKEYVKMTPFNLDPDASALVLWVYFNDVTNDDVFAGNSASSNTYVRIIDDNTIRINAFGGVLLNFVFPSNFINGTWYCIGTSRDSGTTKVYRNGIESSTGGLASANMLTLDQFARYEASITILLDGRISDIEPYSEPKDAAWFLARYNAG